jgi:hypothetical protein
MTNKLNYSTIFVKSVIACHENTKKKHMKHKYNLSSMSLLQHLVDSRRVRTFLMIFAAAAIFLLPESAKAQPSFSATTYIDQEISCFGYNDGALVLDITPSVGAYKANVDGGSWATLPFGNTFTGLTPGFHTIGLTDTLGTDTIYVVSPEFIEPAQLIATMIIDQLVDCTPGTGALSVDIQGGTIIFNPGYSTLWRRSNGDTLNPLNQPGGSYETSFANLTADTYSVEVTDEAGCVVNTSIYLPSLCLFVDQDISCNGANDGTIQASSSLTGSLTYNIDNGAFGNTTGLFLNLTPNLHTVCVSNDGGITSYCATAFISEPDPLTATIIVDQTVSCLGNDGQLSVDVQGGTANLQSYLTVWTNSNGDTINDQMVDNFALTISNLVPDTYSVRLEDDNSCTLTVSGVLGLTPPIVVTANANPILCNGGSTVISASSTGGTGTVTFAIGSTPLPASFSAGTYTITGTDALGCTGTTSITLADPAQLSISLSIDELAGCTNTDYGTLRVTVNTGVPMFNIDWFNSSNANIGSGTTSSFATLGGLTAGNYAVLVTDANGCTVTQSISLPNLCLFHDQEISCFGSNDGTVQASSSLTGTLLFGIDGGALNNASGLFLNLTPGTHTICVTNDGGITSYCDTVIMIEPLPLSATFVVDQTVSCLGNDGQLTIVPAGGTAELQPYLTVWTNSNGDTLNDQINDNFATTLSGLASDTYTVRIEDDNSCVLTVSGVLGLTPALVVNASASPILCNGGSTTVSATSTGGTGTVTYAIGATPLPASFTGGTYTVTATDAIGCTATTAITLVDPASIGLTLVADSIAGCSVSDLGGLTVSISGGITPYSVNWFNSSNTNIGSTSTSSTASIGGLGVDGYYVIVTDAGGCSASVSYNMPSLCLFHDQEISCFGANDGTVQASTSLTGTLLYGIDGGALNNASGLFLNLTPGVHTICVTNDGGVTTFCDTVIMIEPLPLSATFVVDQTVSCLGNDGQLTIVPTGGTAELQPYLTVWTNSNGDTLNDQINDNFATTLSGLAAGTYTVRIEDDNSCTLTVSGVLGLTPALVVTPNAMPIACFGGTTNISASSTGGTGVVTFSIGATPLPSSFSAGTYTITGTDILGCTATASITLVDPASIGLTLVADSIAGCSVSDFGGLTVSISGGTTPYSVNWFNSSNTNIGSTSTSSTASIGGLGVDGYYVIVTDAGGCSASVSYNMPSLCLFHDQEISCFGANDGTVQASTSLTGTLLYGIDGGALNNASGLFLNLTPGVHTICVTNDGGVTTFCDTVIMIEPLPLSATFVVDQTVSCLGNDGQLTLVPAGGTAELQPYLTVWTNSNGDTLNDQINDNFATTLSGLAAGTYTVRIEDDNSCTLTVSGVLGLTPALVVNASASPILCNGGSTTVSATSTGGTGTVTYAIGATPLPASFTGGTYTVTATDALGCTATTEIILVDPASIGLTLVADSIAGCSVSDFGGLTVSISGGITPYSVNWFNSSNTNIGSTSTSSTASIGGLGVDGYYVIVTDAGGCSASVSYNMPSLCLFHDQEISCFGANDGTVQASTSLTGTLLYGIDGGALNNASGLFLNLTPGVHTICVTNDGGVTTFCDTVIMIEPLPLSATFVVDQTVSCLGNDGQLTIVPAGGTAELQPYLTVWTNSNGDTLNDQINDNFATTLSGLAAGTYTVRIEDDNSCTLTVSGVLGLTPAIDITPSYAPILCYGGSTTITATATGGTGAIGFTISGGNFTVSAGTYTITGTDALGCTGTTEVVVNQPPFLPSTQSATACGSYTWSVNNQTYTTSGVYIAIYNSVNGCDSSYQLTLTINQPSSSIENVVAANTYTWAANGQTYTSSGTYTTTLVGANVDGCDSNLTLNLAILTLSVNVDQNVSCFGNNDGSALAVAAGGSNNFVFDIDGQNLFVNTDGYFVGLTPGTHTICAKELPSNVVLCETVIITEPDALTVSLVVDSTVSCLGNDGGLTAIVNGGTTIIQPWQAVWANAVPTNSIYDLSVTGLVPGTYTVTIEDDNSCFASASITLGLTPAVTVSASFDPLICYGGSTVIVPTTSGGTGAISTSISGGTYTVGAGTYTLTATDAKGCTATTEVVVTEPALIEVIETVTACDTYTWAVNAQAYTVSGNYTESYVNGNGCDSLRTLQLTINYSTSSVENVVAANSYTWMANGLTYTTSGTYTHTLTNAANCDSSLTLNLSIITIDVVVDQDISCFGNNDGSAQATAVGASGNFTYDVDGQNVYTNTSGFFQGLTPGVHTICAKESPSNVVVCGTVTIAEPAAISIVLTVDSTVSCLGNDGGVTAVVTGGVTTIQPYLTTWAPAVTVDNIYDLSVTGLTPGTYTLTVEDDNLCFASATVTVGLTPPVTVAGSFDPIVCFGGSTVIVPTTSGGTGAISTSISGGTYTVGSGTYTLTATDAKGCTGTTEVVVTEPVLIEVIETVTACDTYTWAINAQAYTVSGNYTESYVNGNGCDSLRTLQLTINYSTSSVENVVAANSYTWMANGLTYTTSGTYTHTLTNAVNCDSSLTLNLSILTINVIVDQDISCFGNNDGSAQATAAGASGNFTYDVDGQNVYTNTSGFFQGLTPGVHTICAKESPSNVVVCGTVTIAEPAAISIVLTVDSTVSCLGNDGGVSAVVTGGTTINQPYLTTWASGVSTLSPYDLSVTGLTPGTYTLTVEDDNLCFASATVTVGLTPPVTVAGSFDPIVCFGGSTVIVPTTSGGTGAISTSISGGTYTVGAGTYTLTATDAKGCTATTEVVVTEPALIEVIETVTACDTYTWAINAQAYTVSGNYTESYVNVNGCDSLRTLQLTINYSTSSIENVVAANSYTWMANGLTYTASGTYTHTLTNAANCDSSLTLNLSIITIGVVVDQDISCFGNNDGSAQATAAGASGNFTYDVDGQNVYTNTSGFFQGLTPGVHTICAKESPSNVVVCGTVTIAEPAAISIVLTVDSTVSCLGNDGGVSAVVTGGTTINQPYLTTWASGVNTLSPYDLSVTGLTPGTYTLTVEDDNLCFASATVTVGLTPALTVSGSYSSIVCFGDNTLITPSTSGGTGAATSTISGGSFVVGAGTYTLTATDAKGCTATTEVVVTQPALLTSTEVVTVSGSYTWAANGTTYTTSGFYTVTLQSILGCDSIANLDLTVLPTGVVIAPKVFLAGPYVADDNLMHDSLRSQGLVPLVEPYSAFPYNRPSILDSDPAEKVTTSAILSDTGSNAIVDWVFIEMRNAASPATIMATKRALLQRDGDVVSSVDGTSPIFFSLLPAGNYYVTIKHRNHLGVMTATALPLNLASTTVDFTTLDPVYVHVAAPPITNAPRKIIGSVAVLWAGDANSNKNVKYNGLSNDKQEILNAVGVATPNTTVFGYRIEDVNMDGMVRYNNFNNDRNYILSNTTGISTPNAVVSQHTPN